MSDKPSVQVDEKAVLEIVNSKSVNTFFQPVVSISTKSIVGFEAFSRGGGQNSEVNPLLLFHDDLKPEIKVDVDRLCRERALEKFKPIHVGHKNMLLFLNINADIMHHVEMGSKVLKHQVASMDIDTGCVVIESQLNRSDTDDFEKFAVMYRNFGYRFCLDNCFVDDVFCQAISRIRPDFIKINGSFYSKGNRKEYSSRALETILDVAEGVGATVIAQGVESEEDSVRLLAAGVHLQQGYYYTKDEGSTDEAPAKVLFRKIGDTHDKFVTVRRKMVKVKKERFDRMFKTVSSICSKFTAMPESRFVEGCKTVVRNSDEVVSMFVMNESGVQMTSRVHVKPAEGRGKPASVIGFEKGVDHAIQDYVMYLDMGYEKFVTPPFLSPYTGEPSCFISRSIYNSEGIRYILCIEISHPG